MCDEPTGNLDTATTLEITDLLESLHRAGATLVVITHNPVVAGRAQRQIAIRDGELTEISPITEVPATGALDPRPGPGAPGPRHARPAPLSSAPGQRCPPAANPPSANPPPVNPPRVNPPPASPPGAGSSRREGRTA